jgi:hypothetical protein
MSGSFLAPPVDYSAGILPGTTGQADPDAFGVAGSTGFALGTGAGAHGVQNVNPGGAMGNPFVAVWQWLNTPFQTPLSPASIAVLVGVILVSVIIWNLILYHIRIAAESI